MHLPSPSLFRAYDVRGVVGESLSAPDFIAIGHAFASMVAEQCQCRTPLIVVLRDGRDSSPNLAEAMMEGLMRAGAHVLDGGMGPTPLCYFAGHHLQADGSVMITGSHNPPDHNGAKFVYDEKPFYGEQLAALRERIQNNQLLHSRGQREEVQMLDEYVQYLLRSSHVAALDKLSAVWDAGNGAAGVVVKELLIGREKQHTGLFLDADGSFPNHHPDPADPHTLEILQATVREKGAALGLAFDGDGDRMGAVDELGRIVSPDHMLMLLARDVLARRPGARIMADVKTSDAFFDFVRQHGGIPEMGKTGHAHFKTAMPELGVIFGGEASGHLFFADEYFGYDDGIYAALRLARIVAESGKQLSELVDALPKLAASSELRIPCPDDRKFAITDAIAAEVAKRGDKVNTLDGVRVSSDDGWWLLRASNTQPALVARAEGHSAEGTERLLENLRRLLAAQDVALAA